MGVRPGSRGRHLWRTWQGFARAAGGGGSARAPVNAGARSEVGGTSAGQQPIRAAGAQATASAPPLGLPRVWGPAALSASRGSRVGLPGSPPRRPPAACVGPRAGPLCLGLRSLPRVGVNDEAGLPCRPSARAPRRSSGCRVTAGGAGAACGQSQRWDSRWTPSRVTGRGPESRLPICARRDGRGRRPAGGSAVDQGRSLSREPRGGGLRSRPACSPVP